MSRLKADIKHLRWSIAVLLAAIVGAVAIGGLSYVYRQDAEKQQRLAATQQLDYRAKLSQAAQEEQELREKLERFLALKQRGLVGAVNRLDWIEQLTALGRAHALEDFQYDFAPQKPVEPLLIPGPPVGGAHRFVVSAQRFTAKVLHEGNLLDFLAALRREVRALVVVRACAIERLPPPTGTERGLPPQLKVECELDWVSFLEMQ